eukprot:5723074-Prymnesium_polylepis.1
MATTNAPIAPSLTARCRRCRAAASPTLSACSVCSAAVRWATCRRRIGDRCATKSAAERCRQPTTSATRSSATAQSLKAKKRHALLST